MFDRFGWLLFREVNQNQVGCKGMNEIVQIAVLRDGKAVPLPHCTT